MDYDLILDDTGRTYIVAVYNGEYHCNQYLRVQALSADDARRAYEGDYPTLTILYVQ